MHTWTCIHVYKLQMAANMEESISIMFNMHVGVYVHVHTCVCVHGATPTHPHPPPTQSTHPPPQEGPGISQNSITLELIKIIQFCLKI